MTFAFVGSIAPRYKRSAFVWIRLEPGFVPVMRAICRQGQVQSLHALLIVLYSNAVVLYTLDWGQVCTV